jgi:hypothetical protein
MDLATWLRDKLSGVRIPVTEKYVYFLERVQTDSEAKQPTNE